MDSNNQIKPDEIEILIVEDSPTQAERLRRLIQSLHYNARVAANGQLALAAIRERKPHLVLSDIVMPEMNGYELCRAIKSDPTLRDIPVILVTSLNDPKDIIRGIECGADNFVRKPYAEDYLLSRISHMLMNQKLRKNQNVEIGIALYLGDQKHFINADRQQILDLLISTYEQAVQVNGELQARERSAHFGAAREHCDFGLVERRREHARHQLRRARCELAGLDHRPVAGCEHARQRRECQVHREVPGRDDPDCALRLVFDVSPGAEQPEDRRTDLALLSLHPLAQIVLGVLERGDRARYVGEQGGVHGTMPEILT